MMDNEEKGDEGEGDDFEIPIDRENRGGKEEEERQE